MSESWNITELENGGAKIETILFDPKGYSFSTFL